MDKVEEKVHEISSIQDEWWKIIQFVTQGRDPRIVVQSDIFDKKVLRLEFQDRVSEGKSDAAFYRAVQALCEVGALKRDGKGWRVIEGVNIVVKPDTRPESLKKKKRTTSPPSSTTVAVLKSPSPQAKKASKEKALPPSDIVTTPVEEPETISAASPPSSPEELRQQSLSEKIEAVVASELEPGYRTAAVLCSEGVVFTLYQGLILPTSSSGGE